MALKQDPGGEPISGEAFIDREFNREARARLNALVAQEGEGMIPWEKVECQKMWEVNYMATRALGLTEDERSKIDAVMARDVDLRILGDKGFTAQLSQEDVPRFQELLSDVQTESARAFEHETAEVPGQIRHMLGAQIERCSKISVGGLDDLKIENIIETKNTNTTTGRLILGEERWMRLIHLKQHTEGRIQEIPDIGPIVH
ncbi:MAG: hypothetical protein ABH851_09065 [Methanobacteriota archaeon]